jgi:uncharacterized membrane protein HdeD (DUF308 family)
MGYPRPNWYVFNRVSLMPLAGVIIAFAGIAKSSAWLIVAGIACVVFGAWLTMRRLTGRISERSLAWVAIDTAVVGVGAAIGFALHASGAALFAILAVPVFASDAIATAVTGVKEAK